LLVLVTLAVGILIGTVVSNGVKGASGHPLFSDASTIQVPAANPKQQSSVFAAIAKQLEPSVVNINTESIAKPDTRTPQSPRRRSRPQTPDDQDNNSPFDDFFDRFFGGGGGQGPDTGRPERALGSGVIVDSKGYVVTNEHVVEGADRIKVKLQGDPEPYDGKVVGRDGETDLAVVKIEPRSGHPLTAAKLGNSDGMQVGDWVLAVGSPFGLEETVTAGIVSAKGRNIVPRKQFQSFIQTDAAINPGNSGGPLVNMNGEVIGINTAIFTQGFSQGYMGVGFAMPSNTVADVYNQLISPEHHVTRGSIGVQFNAEANPAVARVYGIKSGVTISDVTKGGPAEAAGLHPGDTITAVNGHPVTTGDELVSDVTKVKPGNKVTLSFLRSGQQQTASVTVADRNKLYGEQAQPGEEGPDEGQPQETKLGLSVRTLTNDVAERLDIPAKGVVVTDVRPGSFADDVGLTRGDVILQVNKQAVNTEDDFRKVTLQFKSGDDVVFLVRQGRGRNSGTIFVGGKMP